MGIEWPIQDSLPRVWADRHGLVQVFLNLARNSQRAMQRSETKRLCVSASDEGSTVVVRFEDTGVGISSPENLFRPFQRGADSSGLGLYVSRAIIHSFGGKILVVTAGVEEREAAELIRCGISGIFMKHNSAALLGQGIRDVMAGKVWFDQELLQATMHGSAPLPESQSERFTQRERQVLSYVLEGLANKEIAASIGVSESSVKGTPQQLF